MKFDALLLVSFGGPEGPDDLMPFLQNVVRGRRVPEDRLRVVAEQYRLFSVYSWVSAVSTAAMGARWQPEKLAHGAMERTTQALADLDVPELLSRRFERTRS